MSGSHLGQVGRETRNPPIRSKMMLPGVLFCGIIALVCVTNIQPRDLCFMCPLWESSIQFSVSFMSCFFLNQKGDIHSAKWSHGDLTVMIPFGRLCQWAVHSGIAVVEVNDSVLGQTIFEAVKIGLWLPGERHFEWWNFPMFWAWAAPWPLEKRQWRNALCAPEALSMRDLFTEANVLAQEAAVEGKMEWFYHIESMLMSSSVPIQAPKSARLLGSFYNDEDESDLYNWPLRYHIKKKAIFLRFARQEQTAKHQRNLW